MININVYVGCALTGAPRLYKKRIESFKKKLRKIPGVTVLDFCPPPPGQEQSELSPKVVYQTDIIDGVGKADIFLAEISRRTSGLGLELGVAIREHRIHTVMYAKKGVKLSKLMQGIPCHNPHVSLLWYEKSLDEMLPGVMVIADYVRNLKKKLL